jgi:replicative DNA helicase
MTDKLKTVHLLYILCAALVTVGIAWGALSNQQANNSKAIEKKASKEAFEMHIRNQTQQFQSLETTINNGFERIDKRLDTMK